jgi:phosphoglycerate-specific signal transduction histidine kinase
MTVKEEPDYQPLAGTPQPEGPGSGSPAQSVTADSAPIEGWTLRQKLQISFFVFVLLVALVGFISYQSVSNVMGLVQLILEYDTKHVEISNEIRTNIFKINKNIEAFIYSWETLHLNAVNRELEQVTSSFSEVRISPRPARPTG